MLDARCYVVYTACYMRLPYTVQYFIFAGEKQPAAAGYHSHSASYNLCLLRHEALNSTKESRYRQNSC